MQSFIQPSVSLVRPGALAWACVLSVIGYLWPVSFNSNLWGQTKVDVVLHQRPIYLRDKVLRLSDIATFKNGPRAVHDKLAGIDFDPFAQGIQSTQLTAENIYYSIRLRRLTDRDFQLIHTENLTIHPITTAEVSAVFNERLTAALAHHWQVPSQTIRFTIDPLHLQTFFTYCCHPDQCQWGVRYPSKPPEGRARLEVQLRTPENKVIGLQLPYDYDPNGFVTIQPVGYQTADPGFTELPRTATAGFESTVDPNRLAGQPFVAPAPVATNYPSGNSGSATATPIPTSSTSSTSSTASTAANLAPANVAPSAANQPPTAAFPADLSAIENTTASGGEVVVKANSNVTLVLKTAAITIKVRNGRALQKGAVGDVIQVRNPKNPRAVLHGRIIDSNTVEVAQ